MVDSTRPTIGALSDAWLTARTSRGEITELTAARYRRALDLFACSVGLDTPVDQITAEHFERWLGSVTPARGGSYAPSSRNILAGPVRTFMGWAWRRGHIPVDPTLDVGRSRVPVAPPRRLSRGAVRRFVDGAPPPVRPQAVLMWHLGLRLGEVARLRVSDWDRAGGLLTVAGKGARWRVLPVPDATAVELGRWVDHLAYTGVRSVWMWPSAQVPGEPEVAGWIGRRITLVGVQLGIHVTPHMLRHTCLSEMVEDGVDLQAVRQIAGHASLQSTSIYTTSAPEHLRAQVGRRRL